MSFEFEDESELVLDETELQDEDYNFEGVEFYTEEEFRARGVNPIAPTAAKPGSEGKVLTLAARYAAGLPLWNDNDCYDHGPGAHRMPV